ncbi:hypothetical protein KO361_04615 [Candidatus Woesearchaeota archaeon]|nr:hypothetical protein [Candidatus Woesearchaeota archaeon]
MSKPKYIYILPEFANSTNLKNKRGQFQDEYSATFSEKDIQISLTETNSLVEDEYCLNLKSAKFTLEGETKESMIHHHKKGHSDKHLQFKLYARNQEIRIFLEKLDDEDYQRCIKGFLYVAKELIKQEQENNSVKENLVKYFFNEKIEQLILERNYLLNKINESFNNQKILNNAGDALNQADIKELQREEHLKLFLDVLTK